ncbi:MAG: hypothetical protein ACXWH1_13795, partial [Thermoanaerobaculia bacterium]
LVVDGCDTSWQVKVERRQVTSPDDVDRLDEPLCRGATSLGERFPQAGRPPRRAETAAVSASREAVRAFPAGSLSKRRAAAV